MKQNMNFFLIRGTLLKGRSKRLGDGDTLMSEVLIEEERPGRKSGDPVKKVQIPVVGFGGVAQAMKHARGGDDVLVQGKLGGRISEGKDRTEYWNGTVTAGKFENLSRPQEDEERGSGGSKGGWDSEPSESSESSGSSGSSESQDDLIPF